jgi:DNA-binding NtrC family response regulator
MRHPTVLVVDDEPLVRWSVSETLSDSGYRVVQAGDALSALEAVQEKGGADVVLLDLRLPDARDLTVLSMMRRLSPKTPVILMTAYGSDTLDAEARTRGACAVINKPFDMSALPALVKSALS